MGAQWSRGSLVIARVRSIVLETVGLERGRVRSPKIGGVLDHDGDAWGVTCCVPRANGASWAGRAHWKSGPKIFGMKGGSVSDSTRAEPGSKKTEGCCFVVTTSNSLPLSLGHDGDDAGRHVVETSCVVTQPSCARSRCGCAGRGRQDVACVVHGGVL